MPSVSLPGISEDWVFVFERKFERAPHTPPLMVTTTIDDHIHVNTQKYFVDFYWERRDGTPFI